MEEISKKTAAIILAAGVGSRTGCKKTKQTIEILGKSVLKHTLLAFDEAKSVSELIVVCRYEERDFVNKELQSINTPSRVVNGGKCRAESAFFGFESISSDTEFVLIHDAARCLVTPYEIDTVAKAVYEHKAATASTAVNDTVKRCEGMFIKETVPRKNLRATQTPQAFSCEIYRRALNSVAVLDETITDDNMLAELIGIKPYCVETSASNIKITTSYDLELAEFILSKRKGGG